MNNPQIEGHWYSKQEPHFPMPIHSDEIHPKKLEILTAYDNLIQTEMEYGPSNDWKNDKVTAYRGWSACRCCDFGFKLINDRWTDTPENREAVTRSLRVNMGNKEYRYNGWIWPEGFRHYIDIHNVVPCEEFLTDVLGITL